MELKSLEDLLTLVETIDVECKAAQGKSGEGEIPESIWESYSAMANTAGGDIFLGIEETKDHRFLCKGIKNPPKVQKSFWDNVRSKKKVSKDILTDKSVELLTIDGKTIVHIAVPRADRHDRPVFIGANPLGGTFVRRHEGDYKADEETVKRMMAEAVEDSRDDRILEYFSIDDLEFETVNAYRNRFSALKPSSPWIDLPVEQFLMRIGASRKDRDSGNSGITAAGLLMFGRYETIIEVFPNYMVDYQERPEPKREARWIDRIIPDGTWSGNLYDFYQKAIRKLTADLKVPFKLHSETRIDDTPIHQALREALTNTIIHADFTGRVSVLAVKRPDMFGFRNPGLMRVSVEQALSGGISDCRNHRIQDMFRYVGLGDHAGSGIPSILKSWKSQHWRTPLLYESRDYEQTLLELRTISLFPEDCIQSLRDIFGLSFDSLSELARIILATAETEGVVTHARIKDLSTEHPRDISAELTRLVHEGFLEKHGETRASEYSIPGKVVTTFAQLELSTPVSSPRLDSNSPHLSTKLEQIIKELGYSELPKKIQASVMRGIITSLCGTEWVELKTIAALLRRDAKALQNHYLSRMIRDGELELKYPDIPNHPGQAYKAKQ